MTEVIAKGVFKSNTFSECFEEMFVDDRGHLGVLGHILNQFPTTPAKGGSSSYYSKYSDVSYFIHVLNGAVLGGRMFERWLLKMESQTMPSSELSISSDRYDLGHYNRHVRLFFSAMALHDINKLFESGNPKSWTKLGDIFDKNRQEILKMIGSYMESLGEIDQWLFDLKYLILATEEGTHEETGRLKTVLSRPDLEKIAMYLKFGDQVSATKNDHDYLDSLDRFIWIRNLIEGLNKSDQFDVIQDNVHFLRFPDIPQTQVRMRFCDTLSDLLSISGRSILLTSPDSVIYYGREIDQSFEEDLYQEFYKRYIENVPDEYIKLFPPGNNRINFDFADQIVPTPEVLNKYVETYNSRLLLWSGEEWRKNNGNFISIAKNWGITIRKAGERGEKFRVEWSEESLEDPEIHRRRNLVKLACAKRLLLELENDQDLSERVSDIAKGADLIQRKTIMALYYVGIHQENTDAEYERLLERISHKLNEKYHKAKSVQFNKEIISYLLGRTIYDFNEEVPDKTTSCIQCGRFSRHTLKDSDTFGFRATSGGGKKLSKLAYDEKYNGKICDLCLLENKLRKNEFSWNLKKKDAISIKIYMGDFVSPFSIRTAIKALEEESKELIDKENLLFRFSDHEEIQLNYHVNGFLVKPANIKEQFLLLRKTVKLISDTGFKIAITPIFNSERANKEIFVWENAPGWIKSTNLDRFRIDQVNDVNRLLEFIRIISNMGRGTDDIPDIVRGLARGPRSIIGKIWKYYVKEKRNRHWLLSNEEELRFFFEKYAEKIDMTRMENMVDSACDIVMPAPETNNDATWIIRKAIEVYLRKNGKEENTNDLETTIAGRILQMALSRPIYSREISEKSTLDFSRAFVDLMKSRFNRRSPSSEERRDLIAQFAIMYHMEKWKRVMENKEKNKKEGVLD